MKDLRGRQLVQYSAVTHARKCWKRLQKQLFCSTLSSNNAAVTWGLCHRQKATSSSLSSSLLSLQQKHQQLLLFLQQLSVGCCVNQLLLIQQTGIFSALLG